MSRQEKFLEGVTTEFLLLCHRDKKVHPSEQRVARDSIYALTKLPGLRDNLLLAISSQLWEQDGLAERQYNNELKVIKKMMAGLADEEGYISKGAFEANMDNMINDATFARGTFIPEDELTDAEIDELLKDEPEDDDSIPDEMRELK